MKKYNWENGNSDTYVRNMYVLCGYQNESDKGKLYIRSNNCLMPVSDQNGKQIILTTNIGKTFNGKIWKL